MIKKYGNKILTSVSFTGIAISNVKAAGDTKVYVKIGDTIYSEATNGKVTKGNLNGFNSLINELKGLANKLKKDGSNTGQVLDLSNIENDYFVKSVKVGNDEKLTGIQLASLVGDGIVINETNKLTVELVKKEDRIKITYDEALKGARLTKAKEKAILESIIQGKKNTDIDNSVGNFAFSFGGETQEGNTNSIGKETNLFSGNDKLEFKITNFTDNYKTVVCKFETGVEKQLVAGVDLEKLCVADVLASNKNLSDVRTALNGQNVEGGNGSFFNSNANLTIYQDGNNSKKIVEGTKTSEKSKFIVIDQIKEADINPIFLKKTFSVQFDNTGADKKTVKQEFTDKIKDTLNEKFKDQVKISVKDITDEIVKVQANGETTTIIKSTAFSSDLNDINIVGVNTKPSGSLALGDEVNNKNITIKLKAGAFAPNIVQDTITLTFDTNISKDNKELKENIKTAITNFMKTKNTKTSQAAFVKEFKCITGLEMADNTKGLEVADFNFSQVSNGNNKNIDKGGTISLKKSGIEKIADKCFKDQPKPKTNDSNGSSSSDGSGDQNKNTGGCCCKGKNNAQKEDKKDKKS